MAYRINYVVAKTSPNLYAAAQQANLSGTQLTQIEQFSRTVQKNKNLLGMSKDVAKREFNNLDNDVKEMLQFLYPDAEYAKPDPTVGDYVGGFLKEAGKALATPLISVFKVAGGYSRLINLPYLVGRQVAQGENLFSTNVLTDAWDGRKVFDEGALNQAVQDFGKEDVEIAKGLLQGKTPGEIVESQGQLNDKFLDSFAKAFNKDSSFKQVMDAVKYAQVSPGRDIARMIDSPSTKTPDYISGRTKNVSGFVDFMYQILVDPLTYLTFGASKLPQFLAKKGWADINVGDRMVRAIKENGIGGVAKTFDESPLLRKHWDEEIGPMIKDLSATTKGSAEESQIIRKITSQHPGHANMRWLYLLKENSIFDSKAAVDYFGRDVDATLKLISGRTEGVQYFRSGVIVARRSRRAENGFSRYVDGKLNPAMELKEIDKKGSKAWDILAKPGKEEDLYVSPQIAEIQTFTEKLSFKERLGRAFAYTPQGRAIKIGEDAIDTANNFRDTARQVLPRDLADFLTVKFINAEAADQVAVLRSLYYAIMQKYGVDGHHLGKEIIEKELQSHFGSAKGTGLVENIGVPGHLKNVVGGAGVRVLPEGIFYESSGVIHPFQEANAIGNLDYMLLSQLGFEAKNKTKLITYATKGAAQSRTSSNIVNAWTILTLFPRLGMRSAIDEGIMYLLTAPARDIMGVILPKYLALGRAASKIATAVTASRSAEGFSQLFKRKVGVSTVAETIPLSARVKIRQDLAYKGVMPEEMVARADIVADIAQEAAKAIPGNMSPALLDFQVQAFAHGSGVLTGMTNSIVAKASASGTYRAELAADLLLPNKWEEALAAADLTTGAKGRLVKTEDLEQSTAFANRGVAGVHYENWTRYFYGNDKTIVGEKEFIDNAGNVLTKKTYSRFTPVDVFFNNNALETEADFLKARDTLLQSMGIVRKAKSQTPGISITMTHKVDNPKALANAIGPRSRTTELRSRNLTDIEIAEDTVNRILLDMYTAFHGSPDKFNSALLKRMKTQHNKYVVTEKELQQAYQVRSKNLVKPSEIQNAYAIKNSKTATAQQKAKADATIKKHIKMTEADAIIQGSRAVENKWNLAAQSIEFDDFANLTKGFQPSGKMFTTIEFKDVEGIEDVETAFAKLGNNMMDIMDRQVTGILRQPALWVTYFRIRENYAELEKAEKASLLQLKIDTLVQETAAKKNIDLASLTKQEIEKLKNEAVGKVIYKKRFLYPKPGTGGGQEAITWLRQAEDDVKDIVEKKYTEIGLQQAADTILKFVDNPNIRTNFAVSVRNVGRFYRATEDFWRRVYRLKDVSPKVLYRMRLAHTGIDAYGGMYEDANGDAYVMMPMDDIIFKTVESATRVFSGTTAFKQPLFNDFTLKLRLANPSFSPDSGMPTLSGPISALGIISMRNILGKIPGLKTLGEETDNYGLGNIGDNIDLVKAVVPSSLQRVYALLPKSEKDRQEATAAMQAIAFNAARGNIPRADASPEEKYEYLRNIRISAHNILVMRSVLGLLAPVAPTLQESKDVPDYLKQVGITSIRAEFYDYVNAITRKYGGDVQNPYDLAVASFVGNNPNKLVYTVSRDDKQTNVLISKTKEMRNWYINNKSLVDKYGEAAFIFAPRTGEFDSASYMWLEAAGFVENKSLDKYYTDVATSKDKRAYYDIAKVEKEELSQTVSPTARRSIIENATAKRQAMKAANPLLDAIITGGGFEIASETLMFESLQDMIVDDAFKIPEATKSKMAVIVTQLRNFVNFSQDPRNKELKNFADLKRQQKADIEAIIAQMLEGDLIIKEANRAVFQTLLDYYSRDTYRV